MLNEFIVWQKDRKEFVKIEEFKDQCFIDADGNVVWFSYNGIDIVDECIAFPYIGKTDIEGNKIYADCSIVEFDFRYFDIEEYHKVKGYFSFNKELALYEIREPCMDVYRIYYLLTGDIKNLKVIGTLQENKHLLRASDD